MRLKKSKNDAANNEQSKKSVWKPTHSLAVLLILVVMVIIGAISNLKKEILLLKDVKRRLDTKNAYNNQISSGSWGGEEEHLQEEELLQQKETIHVFYNLFTKSTQDEERVRQIVKEQLSLLKLDPPNDHDIHYRLHITSIGHYWLVPPVHNNNSSSNTNTTNHDHHKKNKTALTTTIQQQQQEQEHFEEGNEGITLHKLWKFCRQNNSNNSNNQRVVYLHSKGSYHNTPQNDKFRKWLTSSALSKECISCQMPHQKLCNVCSFRMSPLPHPHTPGNMWLARCDYITKLIDPNIINDNHDNNSPQQGQRGGEKLRLLPPNFYGNNPCKGFGRYFFEHWVYSHPSVQPCDLYPGKQYTWHYDGLPDYLPPQPQLSRTLGGRVDNNNINNTSNETATKTGAGAGAVMAMDLQMAPRFPFEVYAKPNNCGTTKNSNTEQVEQRMWNYKQLYNITTPDEFWWGWKFFNLQQQQQ